MILRKIEIHGITEIEKTAVVPVRAWFEILAAGWGKENHENAEK